MVKRLPFFILLLSLTTALITGCGFHLRGKFAIPSWLQVLYLSPNQPYDRFQQTLKQILTSNEVKIVDSKLDNAKEVSTLILLSQEFSERNIAYGSSGQANRALLQFKISYQLIDPNGKAIISNGVVKVDRELTVNPNAVLGTENERDRLKTDLYLDGALQLVRQLALCQPL